MHKDTPRAEVDLVRGQGRMALQMYIRMTGPRHLMQSFHLVDPVLDLYRLFVSLALQPVFQTLDPEVLCLSEQRVISTIVMSSAVAIEDGEYARAKIPKDMGEQITICVNEV